MFWFCSGKLMAKEARSRCGERGRGHQGCRLTRDARQDCGAALLPCIVLARIPRNYSHLIALITYDTLCYLLVCCCGGGWALKLKLKLKLKDGMKNRIAYEVAVRRN